MVVPPGVLFTVLWLGWFVSWIAAAFWSAPATRRARGAADIGCRVLIVLGAILFFRLTARGLHAHRLWHVGLDGAYGLAALTAAGFAFAWWARLHLGRLWSGSITAKAGHHVVDTGPYRLVRHPIYTGLILSILATCAAKANAVAVLGAAMMLVGLWWKARREEMFLAAELSQGAYAAYRARVPMLVPFIPPGGAI